jgi:DNA polymerase type B, organellar and viral
MDDKNKIAIINNELYDFLYRGYYGGAVDAYIPVGEDIKDYDVNSLYPTSMFNNPIPVGNPYYFEGDIKYFKNYAFPTEEYLNTSNKKIQNKIKDDLSVQDNFTNEKPINYKSIIDYVINIFNMENYNEFENKIKLFLNLDDKNGTLCNKDNLPFGFFEVNLETPPKEE